MVEEALVIVLVALGLVLGAGEAARKLTHSLQTVECSLDGRTVCVYLPPR